MEFKQDKLIVEIFETRDDMGKAAAKDISECIKKLLSKKSEINIIFAAAPSQNDMLAHLCEKEGIDWERINAFHMDEYIGIKADAPQRFGNFLKEHIFSKKPFKSISYINTESADVEYECKRYAELILKNKPDIVLMGIGENGHIAFNDPHIADFEDKELVKAVSLDDMCRMQQVNDGCFKSIDDVPRYAITLTIPALMSAEYKFCVVPSATKANAVKDTLIGDINEKCPASILRTKENTILYCDSDSAKLYLEYK